MHIKYERERGYKRRLKGKMKKECVTSCKDQNCKRNIHYLYLDSFQKIFENNLFRDCDIIR